MTVFDRSAPQGGPESRAATVDRREPRRAGRRDAIVVERLSKRYRRSRHGVVPAPSLFSRLRPGSGPEAGIGAPFEADDIDDDEVEAEDEGEAVLGPSEVWALSEVAFRVPEGCTFGLIGPNGSGKTTLLKILARITPPTSGRALLRGRVAPLIEIASSLLQDDLTARDNIVLLARFFDVPVEIARRRTEEIIEFAELDDAVDLQVRRYSSGLKRRLAFSIVLNLEPDILLADEILSVGDAAFQRRCLERVDSAAKGGLTTLFASHDLDLVRSLCHRVAWLDGGRLVDEGEANEIVDRYERQSGGRAPRDRRSPSRDAGAAQERPGRAEIAEAAGPGVPARPMFATAVQRVVTSGGPLRSFTADAAILSAQALDTAGAPVETFRHGNAARLELSLEVASPVEVAGSIVLTRDGRPYLRLVQAEAFAIAEQGFYTVAVEVPGGMLLPGTYGGKTGVWVVTPAGDESVLVRRRDFAFTVVGDDEPPRKKKEKKRRVALERTDLPWSVTRVTR